MSWLETSVVLAVLALVGGLSLLWLYFEWVARKLRQELDARPKPPCTHRYIQTTYTLQPDGKASGKAFCADCKSPVNVDVLVTGGTPYDAGLGYIGAAPGIRAPAPEPTVDEQVMVSRKDLEVMLEKLLASFPPKDCWDCKTINPPVCFSCVERARVRGELSFLEDALTGYLRS